MQSETDSNYSNLIEFINQCPIGIVKANKEGEIELLNALGAQLLIPLSITAKVDLSNILSLLRYFEADFVQEIESFSPTFGMIREDHRFEVAFDGSTEIKHFNLSVSRISPDTYQYVIRDITQVVAKEEEIKLLIEATTLQSAKLEMSTGLLHDVGNAVTAFGTEVANIKSVLEWRELKDLEKLIDLFTSKSSGLDEVMGEGKGKAIIKFTQAVKNSLNKKNELLQQSSNKLYESTSHIQQVLNIQRHFVKDKSKSKRDLISLKTVVEDALAIQSGNFVKRDISLEKNFDAKIPEIEGDQTRLIQVMINAFKNSIEAFDGLEKSVEKHIVVSLKDQKEDKSILLEVKDNAAGFSPEIGAGLFEKGNTTKESGTGFGLYNCKQIIESHHGEISIKSDGTNKGASLIIILPY